MPVLVLKKIKVPAIPADVIDCSINVYILNSCAVGLKRGRCGVRNGYEDG